MFSCFHVCVLLKFSAVYLRKLSASSSVHCALTHQHPKSFDGISMTFWHFYFFFFSFFRDDRLHFCCCGFSFPISKQRQYCTDLKSYLYEKITWNVGERRSSGWRCISSISVIIMDLMEWHFLHVCIKYPKLLSFHLVLANGQSRLHAFLRLSNNIDMGCVKSIWDAHFKYSQTFKMILNDQPSGLKQRPGVKCRQCKSSKTPISFRILLFEQWI